MRLLTVVLAFLAFAPSAHACVKVPAKSATRVSIAFAAGTDLKKGTVAVDQPGKPIRRLDTMTAEGLNLENGRTLVWGSYAFELGFFDLRRKPCPNRAGFKQAARSDRVIVTYHEYDFS